MEWQKWRKKILGKPLPSICFSFTQVKLRTLQKAHRELGGRIKLPQEQKPQREKSQYLNPSEQEDSLPNLLMALTCCGGT